MTVFRSPRWRKRLAWLGAAALLVGAALMVSVRYSNSGREEPEEAAVGAPQEAQVYHEPKHIRLTRAQRAKVLATAANFVSHAVARQGVEQAYDLTHPMLRQGMSRAEWRGGTIPVEPFPVGEARWKLVYAYEDAIGLQVLLFPTAKSGLRPAVFDMELAPLGRRYLVSSWAPTGMAGGGTPSGPAAAGVGGTRDLGASLDGPARLDQRWLLAPIVLFALVPLLLIGFFIRGWLRGRRAAAAYAGAGRELPPLPRPRP
ncbi:MAG TPA: hypothetical protein VFP24_06375 [Gaiellaceae bacterium]|nr:hypothetical protein [Gaiellaceae bacterium]